MNIPKFTGALCASIGVDLFYTDDEGEYMALDQIRAICGKCPARFTCMEWAMKHETEGVWAGTTPIQRKHLRRKLGITVQRLETNHSAA